MSVQELEKIEFKPSNAKVGVNTSIRINKYPCEFGLINKKNSDNAYAQIGMWVQANDGYEIEDGVKSIKYLINKSTYFDLRTVFGKDKISNEYDTIKIIDLPAPANSTERRRINNSWTFLKIDLHMFFNDVIVYDEEFNQKMINFIQMVLESIVTTNKLSFRTSRKG